MKIPQFSIPKLCEYKLYIPKIEFGCRGHMAVFVISGKTNQGKDRTLI